LAYSPHETKHKTKKEKTNKGKIIMSATPYMGTVMLFCGNFAPLGWQFCDGSLLPIAQYDALFALIGTTYGGDGQTTFAVPDLRGRVPIHQGQGGGLSSFVIGQTAGSETVTVTTNQIPVHTHALGSSGVASTTSPATNAPATASKSIYAAAPGVATPMAAGILGSSGSNAGHNNLQPYLTINFVIATEGIFPSRN
jgi:microcystin-dependent protein